MAKFLRDNVKWWHWPWFHVFCRNRIHWGAHQDYRVIQFKDVEGRIRNVTLTQERCVVCGQGNGTQRIKKGSL